MLFFFFFNDTATTEIYTLSLHDALPICGRGQASQAPDPADPGREQVHCCRHNCLRQLHHHHHPRDVPAPIAAWQAVLDRKSTRLNSSHANISYAVFCLKENTSELQSRQY